MVYYPEGTNSALVKKFSNVSELTAAIKSREIIEGKVSVCDSCHNLYVDLGAFTGMIPRLEGAIGILEGTTRDIALISKVNRLVCFRIMGIHRNDEGEIIPILSRRNVQLECKKEYIEKLETGDIIDAKVTRLEGFGAFIDIGCGINSLIPIDMLSVSRITHTRERLSQNQIIRTVLRSKDDNKLTFSLKELLGTWEENVAAFSAGETVSGIVRSIEPYGVFVELTPNLAGLADPKEGLKIGQRVSVFIKSISSEKMKIKLAVVEAFNENEPPGELDYYVCDRHICSWNYSPNAASKSIYTYFS